MKKQTLLPLSPSQDTTEALLQGLIAECGAMIRDRLRPALDANDDIYKKSHLVSDAVALMKTGATMAEAIARLRGQPAPELRQRITVERVQSLSTGEGG